MKQKFSLKHTDVEMITLIESTDKKILAVWAIECARRVLPYFEEKYPKDKRPQKALEILQKWIDTGKFSMAVIRKASLDAHVAARSVGEDSPARSAARACGQAVATAHVARHAYGPAIYAQQAIFRASDMSSRAMAAVASERNWQYGRLLQLSKKKLTSK